MKLSIRQLTIVVVSGVFLLVGLPVFSESTHYDYGSVPVADATKSKDVPERDVAIIASPNGFFPDRVTVFQGERVRFYVTSTDSTPGCFIIQKKDLFLSADKGRVNEGTTVFQTPGEFAFHCPTSTGMMKGMLVVLPRPGKRGVASVTDKKKTKPDAWVPKD